MMETRYIPVSGGPSRAAVPMKVSFTDNKIVCEVWLPVVPKQYWEQPIEWIRQQVPELSSGHWGFYKQYDNESGILVVSFRPYAPQVTY